MAHKITLQDVVQLTPDTRHFTFSKPPEYEFAPGQATELSIDKPGWEDEKRPFTFTSDPDANVLCFTIKSYPDHEGVTQQLAKLRVGEQVMIDDPWGAISNEGPGIFIAGGAGITPFIGILRDLARKGELQGAKLIFANQTEDGIILRHQWEGMDGLETAFPLPEGDGPSLTEAVLDDLIPDVDRTFYVCGPPPMEEMVVEYLTKRGVSGDRIVQEE